MSDKLKCPECGKEEFTDPRHLGRHRRFVHSVPGNKNFRKDGTLRKGVTTLPPGITASSVAPPPRSTSQAFKCPECGLKLKDAVVLGRHRRAAHGIPGKSAKYNTPEKLARRNAKRRPAKAELVHVEPVHENDNGHHKRPAMVKSPNGFPLLYIGNVVGFLEAKCHEEAYKNDLPAKAFTRDVAEYFLAKTTIGQ